MKINFWESFAISVGISALSALVQSTALTVKQKADIEQALAAVQQVQADFAQ